MKHVRPYHFAIPVGFEGSTALVSLRVALRKPDAAIYAIRLWHHRHRCGEAVSDLNSAAVLEDIAGWRGKRGALVDAMLSAGLLARGEDESEIEIVDPHDVARVEWMGGRTEKAGESQATETPAERRRRLDRERKRAEYRQRKAAEKSGESAENPKSLHIESGESPQVSKSLHGNSPQVSTEKTGESAENSTPNARADQDLDQDLDSKNTPPPPAGGQGTLPVAVEASPPAQPKRARAKRKTTDDATEASITRILTHWRERAEKPKAAIEGDSAKARRRRIRQRLEDGLTEEELLKVADGHLRSPWHMGTDPNCTKPGGYRDVATLYRDREQCEKFIELADAPLPGPGGPDEPPPRPIAPPPDLPRADPAAIEAARKARDLLRRSTAPPETTDPNQRREMLRAQTSRLTEVAGG